MLDNKTERLINGKTLKQVEEELRAPIPEDQIQKRTDSSGDVYIPVDAFKDRLDEVLGTLHYSIGLAGEVSVIDVGGVPQVITPMELMIFDDEGKEVVRKSANGAARVIQLRDSGNPKSFKSDLAGAESEALKQIGKKLGIGDAQLRSLNKKGGGRKTSYNNANKKPAAQSDVLEGLDSGLTQIRLAIRGKFEKYDSFIKAPCLGPGGREAELIIFKDHFKVIEEKIPIDDFCKLYAGKSLSIEGSYKEYNGKLQIIFNKPLAA